LTRGGGSERWLRDIETRAHVIFDALKERDKRIKIAILDTGVDMGHHFFQSGQRKGRIKECRSWIPSRRGDEDVNGHGTHAAALLLRVAPGADVYVARVVDDDATVNDPMNIAKVCSNTALCHICLIERH
jgi:hypothetical protein